MSRNNIINKNGSINFDYLGDTLDTYALHLTDDYNAKRYGAVGDGITNDTHALNKLILFISSNGGGTIYLPKGTYKLSSSLMWKSNVSLRGDGIGKSILQPNDQGVWTFSAISSIRSDFSNTNPMINCTFSDFEIDATNTKGNSYYVSCKGIFIQYMRNCIFRNLYIHDTKATGLGIDYLDKVLMENVICYNCGKNWFSGRTGCAGIGIGTGGLISENCIITNCQTIDCGQYGIFIEDQILFGVNPHYTSVGIIISNNIVKNGLNHGIGIKGGDKITVCDNIIYGNSEYGIYVGDVDTSNLKIVGNILNGNSVGLGFATGNTYANVEVKDNNINANIGTNILVNAKTITRFNISGNEISSSTGGSGLVISAMTTAPYMLTIKDNISMSNGTSGIKVLSGGDSVDISNNNTIGNSNTGINIDGAFTHLSVINNHAWNKSGQAVQQYGITQNATSTVNYGRIEMNDTRTNTVGNLTLSGTNTNTIDVNNI